MTKEQAIQILSTRDAHGVICGYTSGVTEALDLAIEALKEIDKPKGEWVRLSHDTFHCILCGRTFIVMQGSDAMNFCPNCGTRMVEERSES